MFAIEARVGAALHCMVLLFGCTDLLSLHSVQAYQLTIGTARCHGLARISHQVPVTPGDTFRGGSVVRPAGIGRAKYTTGIRLGTSHGRGWNGLLAERWRHSEGDLGEVQPRDTEVIVLLRGRLHVRRRGDGWLQHHNAIPGTAWLYPAGFREDMIHLYGEVEESLHLYLPASPLSQTALREIDVDPDRIELHYDGGFLDPMIEQIARAVHAEMLDAAPGRKMLVETLAAALRIHILRRYSNLEPASIAAGGPRRARLPASATRHGVHRFPSG